MRRHPFITTARLALLGGAFVVACAEVPDFGEDEVPVPGRQPGDDAGTGDETGENDAATTSDVQQVTGEAGGGDASGDAEGGAATPALCNAPNLIACFTFDGSVTDHSASKHTPSVVQNVTFGAGRAGSAAYLAANSAIRFAPSATWTSATVTVEAFVRPTSRAGDMFVFDADQRYAVIVRDNGELRCVGPGGNVDGGSVPLGVFTHVACVFVGGQARVYTGGVLRDAESSGTGTNLGSGTAIGGDAPSGSPFIGAIDSLRVFRGARSAADIAAAAAAN